MQITCFCGCLGTAWVGDFIFSNRNTKKFMLCARDILFTSYSCLIKSSLVRLSSALVMASEFTGNSILPDIKRKAKGYLRQHCSIEWMMCFWMGKVPRSGEGDTEHLIEGIYFNPDTLSELQKNNRKLYHIYHNKH